MGKAKGQTSYLLNMERERYEQIKEVAKGQGKAVSQYLNSLVTKDISSRKGGRF